MSNAIKGRDFILNISDDGGTTWKLVAGIRTKEFTRENPVADSTNQATSGNETESKYTGYSTVTLSGGGTADTTAAGASLLAFNELVALANSADPEALCQLVNPSIGTFEGDFNITSLGLNTEQNGIVEFSIALQNKGTITFTAGT